jgi:hypothetical protein
VNIAIGMNDLRKSDFQRVNNLFSLRDIQEV